MDIKAKIDEIVEKIKADKDIAASNDLQILERSTPFFIFPGAAK